VNHTPRSALLRHRGLRRNGHHQKGTQVNHTAKAPTLRTVAGVSRFGLLRVKGSGAPSLRPLGLALLGALSLLVMSASSASAAATRNYESQITEAGSPLAPLVSPTGLTTDASDDLWVSDTGTHTVTKFDSSGTNAGYLTQNDGTTSWGTSSFIEGLAFSAASGEVLVSDSNFDDIWGLKATDATNSGLDLFGGPWDPGRTGCCLLKVAADNSGTATDGDLYVSAGSPSQNVTRIDATGAAAGFSKSAPYITGAANNVLTGTTAGAFVKPRGLAVDASGNLYVLDQGKAEVDEFAPSGEFLRAITKVGGTPLGEPTAIAVDPTSGNLLIAEEASVSEIGPGDVLETKLTEANGAPFAGIQGLAVSSTGTLYVADTSGHLVDVFGAAVPVLTATTGPVTAITDTTATVTGEVNPAGIALTACRFEYVTEAAFGASGFTDLSSGGEAQCEPPFGSIPATGQTPVAAAVSGLTPGVVYRYRLLATNATEESTGSPLATPQIVVSESASTVSADSATLGAELNPSGFLTHYRFEYLTQAAYEQNGNSFLGPNIPALVPIPDGLIPAGESPVAVAQPIAGLAPATVYRYRIAATSTLADVHGPTLSFTTQSPLASGLPDNRGYELVSPADKGGGRIEPISEVGVIEASREGGAISYFANAPIEADPPGSAGKSLQILSQRGTGGWTSRNVASPHQRATGNVPSAGPEYRFFASDLSAAVIQPFGLFEPQVSPEASEQTPYLRALGDCESSCYRPLATAKPGFENALPGFGEELPCEEENGIEPSTRTICGPLILAATPDLSHAVLDSAAPLTPGAPDGSADPVHPQPSLYEWSEGQIQLISILPPNEAGEELPASPGTATLGNNFRAQGGSGRRTLSADGSRVFWGAQGNLYLRDTEPGHEQTLQLDLGEGCGTCQSGGGIFQIASTDGSRVFFTDGHPLTEDAGGEFGEPDLYECVIVEEPGGRLACELTDLTPRSGGQNAAVQREVFGAAEDGSAVYFAAAGVLAPNQGADGTRAQPQTCKQEDSEASCNLYLVRNGAVSFIATLSGGDFTDWTHPQQEQPTRVSPNGNWLEFMSERPLTGYDNRDVRSAKPDAEVFLYDANSGQLRCASCDPTGARPVGVEYGRLEPGSGNNPLLATVRGLWPPQAWVAALPPQATSFTNNESAYQSRYLSDSGRNFFNVLGPLVPQDSNGVGDVYQYEPPAGSAEAPSSDTCTTASPTYSPTSAGCVDLISSGTSPEQSGFLDASESGDDVFFLTRSRLTGKDVDGASDVYDARVGGGEPEAVKPVECSGDACQQPATPPNDSTPGSLTFNGAGNVLQCPKGKQLKKGRCVKQKAKKKSHNNGKGKKHKRTAGMSQGASK